MFSPLFFSFAFWLFGLEADSFLSSNLSTIDDHFCDTTIVHGVQVLSMDSSVLYEFRFDFDFRFLEGLNDSIRSDDYVLCEINTDDFYLVQPFQTMNFEPRYKVGEFENYGLYGVLPVYFGYKVYSGEKIYESAGYMFDAVYHYERREYSFQFWESFEERKHCRRQYNSIGNEKECLRTIFY